MGVLPPNLDMLRLKLAASTDDSVAWEIIGHYFQCYHPDEVQEELWLLKTGLVIDEFTPPAPETERDKEDRLFFLEFTMLFTEAVQRIFENRKAKLANNE
jgi:hypothetical protein